MRYIHRACIVVLVVLLVVSQAFATYSVTLGWNPPTTFSNGSPASLSDIGGYILYYGPTSQNYPSVSDVGNITSRTVTGLADSTTYYFVATAYGLTGEESQFSSPELIVRPPASGGDTTKPVVTIISPQTNTTVRRGSTVTISATAIDNVGIINASIYVNNVLLCIRQTQSYSCEWNVPGKKNRTYNLQAKAYDAKANIGASSIVAVTAR
jgi:chitodextrinase